MAKNLIPTADVRDLFPQRGTVHPLVVPSAIFTEFATDELPVLFPHEQLVLACIAQMIAPSVVLEFGTGQGFSAYVWAENTLDQTRIVTIDLSPAERRDYSKKMLRGDKSTGRIQRSARASSKIEQILIDPNAPILPSVEALAGIVDIVFIDGDHGYAGVRSDTELAMSICHGDSVFIWHDFYMFPNYIAQGPEQRGVYPYLNEVAASGALTLYQVAGTYLVVGKKKWGREIRSTLRQPDNVLEPMRDRIIRLKEF